MVMEIIFWVLEKSWKSFGILSEKVWEPCLLKVAVVWWFHLVSNECIQNLSQI